MKYIRIRSSAGQKEYNRYFEVVSYGVWSQSDQYTSYAFDEEPSETAVSNLKNNFYGGVSL